MSLTLAPAIGGGVASFTFQGRDLFRPASPEALEAGDPLGLGSFPLVPFAGRIAHRCFSFEGHAVTLPPNLGGGERTAIHGQGWRGPWRIADHDQDTARLTFDHAAGDWPWDYTAEQTFALEDAALVQRLAVTNTSPDPMPAGLGLHPYFPRDADTRLRADVSGVFLAPEESHQPIPPAWDWRGGPAITAFVDHQFQGWSGGARISWPSRGLALTLIAEPTTPFLVVYAPAEQHFFCVEPVSHQLNAVNLSPGGAGHGMTILEPGGTVFLTTRFEVSQIQK
jgi:aldose 1-epimerase